MKWSLLFWMPSVQCCVLCRLLWELGTDSKSVEAARMLWLGSCIGLTADQDSSSNDS